MLAKLKGGRWWIRIGVFSLLLPLLEGCVPAAGVATPAPAPPVEAPTKRPPQYGGILYYPARTPPTTLNPYTGGRIGELLAFDQVYDYLIQPRYWKEGQIAEYRGWEVEPELTERWEQPNDTTYIFHLRKGVKWHDGVEFTADDVIFSYTLIGDPKASVRLRSAVKDIDKMEAADKYTLKITTKGPAPDFLGDLTGSSIYILPKHVIDRGDRFEKVVVGTGPYKMKSYDSTRGATYIKNEDFYLKGKPYMDGIRLFYGMDPSAVNAALKTQSLDFFNIPDKKQLEALLGVAPDLQYAKFVNSYGNMILLNMSKAPFNDVRVRRAMNLGVDRQGMNQMLSFGEGIAAPPGLPAIMEGWTLPQEELAKMPGYRQPKDADIAEAKRLLAEAGYPGGFKMSIAFPQGFATQPLIAEAVAGQLSRISIQVDTIPMEQGMYNEAQRKGDYDGLSEIFTSGRPVDYINILHSGGAQNTMGLKDAKLDELLDKQQLAIDVKERKKMWLEISNHLWERAYYIPAIDLGSYVVWQPFVHDYVYNRGGQAYLRDATTIWLEADKVPKGRSLE